MRIAFLMDPLETINPLRETTSCLMYECNQRGHTVFFMEPHDIYIQGNKVMARIHNITVPPDQSMKVYWRSIIFAIKHEKILYENLIEMDALFYRKNPSWNYQTMELLEPIIDHIFMINSHKGLLLAKSKLYPLNFPEIIPETHISRDPKRIKLVIDNFVRGLGYQTLGEVWG